MTGRLKHRIRRSSGVAIVTAVPHDGRYPEEFRIPLGELRRFCWAVLADLEPDEAAAAADEEGQALQALAAPVAGFGPRRRALIATRSKRPLPKGCKTWRVLEAIADGAETIEEVRAEVTDAANVGALVYDLGQLELVRRTDAGGAGQLARWEVTAAGLDALGRERRAEAA